MSKPNAQYTQNSDTGESYSGVVSGASPERVASKLSGYNAFAQGSYVVIPGVEDSVGASLLSSAISEAAAEEAELAKDSKNLKQGKLF